MKREYRVSDYLYGSLPKMVIEYNKATMKGFQDSVSKDNVVPFVGAGISMSCGLPSWEGLIEKLAYTYGVQPPNKKKSEDVFEYADRIYQKSVGNKLYNINDQVKNIVSTPNISEKNYLSTLARFSKIVVTTNYDCCLESAFKGSGNRPKFQSVSSLKADDVLDLLKNEKRAILHLHGSVNDSNSIVLSSASYDEIYNKGKVEEALYTIMEKHTILFVGCSLQKDRTLDTIRSVANKLQNKTNYAILEYPGDKLWGKRNQELLEYGIKPLYFEEKSFNRIGDILASLADRSKGIIASISSMFDCQTSEFCEHFLGIDYNINLWTRVYYSDMRDISDECLKKSQSHIQNRESWINTIIGNADLKLEESCQKGNVYKELMKRLFEVPLFLFDFSEGQGDDNRNQFIDILEERASREYFRQEFLLCIWYILYFTIFSEMPDALLYRKKLKQDLSEYTDKILLRYSRGCSNESREIYRLAVDGNFVARVELGELYYYGRGNDGVSDYGKAYEWFSKVNDDTKEYNRHPLAFWEEAYMLFNYRFRLDLKNADISVLNTSTIDERWRKAIDLCVMAINSEFGYCLQAYNLLGVMMDIMEVIVAPPNTETNTDYYNAATKTLEYLKSNEQVCKIIGTKTFSPEMFWEVAKDGGYTLAYNNLSKRFWWKAFKETNGKAKEEFFQMAIQYLMEASKGHCNYSSNKLGRFYETGILSFTFDGRSINVGDFSTYGAKMISEDKAQSYYTRALSPIVDRDSAWAAFNLLKSFGDKVDSSTSVLCKKILVAAQGKYSDVKSKIENNLLGYNEIVGN